MGLDMYLNKKYYIGANYEHRDVRGDINISIADKSLDIKLNEVTYISTQVAYWRKANAIHKWFVDNIQDGDDNCAYYEVSRTQLQDLLDICNFLIKKLITKKEFNENDDNYYIIQNKELAQEKLPSKSGFFFGDTIYDKYYLEDIEYTSLILTKELALNEEDATYEYSSSW